MKVMAKEKIINHTKTEIGTAAVKTEFGRYGPIAAMNRQSFNIIIIYKHQGSAKKALETKHRGVAKVTVVPAFDRPIDKL